jgi:hypothetical protein
MAVNAQLAKMLFRLSPQEKRKSRKNEKSAQRLTLPHPSCSHSALRCHSRHSPIVASTTLFSPREHEDLWGGMERSMSSSLNFGGAGGCEEGKTEGSKEQREAARLGG